MANGVNSVTIIGHLGADPEIRQTQSGDAIGNLSIATTEKWKAKDTGEQKSQTEWHRVVLYRRLAEIAGQYLAKGSLVYVSGKLQTRKWTDQQGVDRYTTEIVCKDLQMLDSKGSGGSQQGQSPQGQKPQQQEQKTQQTANQGFVPDDDSDSDLPF